MSKTDGPTRVDEIFFVISSDRVHKSHFRLEIFNSLLYWNHNTHHGSDIPIPSFHMLPSEKSVMKNSFDGNSVNCGNNNPLT